MRDPDQLEAPLFRLQTEYYADVIEEAAALWGILSQNHPFLDGNKRTAFAATYTFLAINGWLLTAMPDDRGTFVIGRYAESEIHFKALTGWLRLNTKRMS